MYIKELNGLLFIMASKQPKQYKTTIAHRAGSERWNEKNKEKIKGYMKAYFQQNKERIRIRKKQTREKKKIEKLKSKMLEQLKQKIPEKN